MHNEQIHDTRRSIRIRYDDCAFLNIQAYFKRQRVIQIIHDERPRRINSPDEIFIFVTILKRVRYFTLVIYWIIFTRS